MRKTTNLNCWTPDFWTINSRILPRCLVENWITTRSKLVYPWTNDMSPPKTSIYRKCLIWQILGKSSPKKPNVRPEKKNGDDIFECTLRDQLT